MHESPLFQKAKDTGNISKNPLKESFGNRYNFKFVLLALLGATMGQGVIWYTGHYYAMNFLKNDCKVDGIQVEEIMALALLFGTPLFVFFGWFSDKIGRKPIMLAGMLIAILSYFPIYRSMYNTATNAHRTEIAEKGTVAVTIAADKKNPLDSIRTTKIHKVFVDGAVYDESKDEMVFADAAQAAAKPKIKAVTKIATADYWSLIFLVFIQVVFVTMVYGPIAAFLVELFPTRIRYTSMSLPYHIGNGVFGGLMPAVATYLAANAKGTGPTPADPDWYLQGLWYPIVIAGVCFVIGLLYVNGNTHKTIND
jgi:MFS family permease